jgi:hypothetical protein
MESDVSFRPKLSDAPDAKFGKLRRGVAFYCLRPGGDGPDIAALAIALAQQAGGGGELRFGTRATYMRAANRIDCVVSSAILPFIPTRGTDDSTVNRYGSAQCDSPSL